MSGPFCLIREEKQRIREGVKKARYD